jgi:hypothetical protein
VRAAFNASAALTLAAQPAFSGAELGRRFVSAPSASVPPLNFNGVARTVGTSPPPRAPASLVAFRKSVGTKSSAGLDFTLGADEADGAGGRASSLTGDGEVAAVIRMIRLRARASRPKPISTPILRKNVAARPSRPASALGLSGQVFSYFKIIEIRYPNSDQVKKWIGRNFSPATS